MSEWTIRQATEDTKLDRQMRLINILMSRVFYEGFLKSGDVGTRANLQNKEVGHKTRFWAEVTEAFVDQDANREFDYVHDEDPAADLAYEKVNTHLFICCMIINNHTFIFISQVNMVRVVDGEYTDSYENMGLMEDTSYTSAYLCNIWKEMQSTYKKIVPQFDRSGSHEKGTNYFLEF